MAFDLVAKLKLQDEFSDKLKSVFAQLDKLKGQVKQAAIGTSDMGAKFSAASTKMSTALGKVESKTIELPKKFESFGNMANRSLEAVSKGADTLGISTNKAAKLSQASLKTLGSRADEMARKIDGAGKKSSYSISRIGLAGKAMKNVVSGAVNGVTSKIYSIGSSAIKMKDKFRSAGHKIKETMQKNINAPARSAKNAIIGIGSAVGAIALVSKGFNMLKGSIEGAVARYDTLNAFPKVMEKIGFSTDLSKKSLDRLVEGIDGLPTTLNEIAATTQRIAIMTGDLDKATETSIALNNALIASGADSEKAARGTEQYIKMLSTGNVNMDSWTTLQEVMGLGLNDLAKSFGITGDAIQDQLYKKLKDGKITFEQFNNKMIELSKAQGGFAEAALDSAGGLHTAWKNISTAITNGVAGSITAIDQALGGTGEIENIIKKIKPVISDTFKTANEKLGTFVKAMKKLYDATKPYHAVIKEVAKVITIFSVALTGIAIGAGLIAGLTAAFAALSTPITVIVLKIAGVVTALVVAYRHLETLKSIANTVFDVVVEKVEEFKNKLIELKDKAIGTVTKKIQDLNNWLNEHEETITRVAGVLAVIFGPALLKVAGQAAISGAIIVAQFVGSLVKTAAQAVITGIVITGQFIASLVKTAAQALITGAVLAGQFVASMVVTAAQAVATAAVFTGQMIVALVRFAASGWASLISMTAMTAAFVAQKVAMVAGKVVMVAVTAAQWAWNAAMAANPIGAVILLIGGLITAGVLLVKNWDKVKSAWNTTMTVIKDTTKTTVNYAIDMFNKLIETINKIPGINIPVIPKIDTSGVEALANSGGRRRGGNQEAGEGRYNGIKYVPRDGTHIRAHRGERILTAKENKEYDKGGKGRSFVINMNGTVIREEADVDRLAEKMVRKFIAAGEGGA